MTRVCTTNLLRLLITTFKIQPQLFTLTDPCSQDVTQIVCLKFLSDARRTG